MKLDTNSFFMKISLPKRYYDNYIISQKYNYESKKFFEYFDEFCPTELEKDKQNKVVTKLKNIRDDIQNNFNSINKVFKFYEDIDIAKAQIEFENFMDSIKNDLFLTTIDDWNEIECNLTKIRQTTTSNFFRIRPVEYPSDEIKNNPYELFHIPITKRQYSNNERFSLAGFPCLYLSTMLPLAWQECHCPKIYYYSKFRYRAQVNESFVKRNFDTEPKFLSLYAPYEINEYGNFNKYHNFELWLATITKYLKIYPLVLACSFININGKTPYKQEYIIPQMLMQWLYHHIDEIQGITYFSCTNMTSVTDKWCAYNLVMPASPPYDKDGKYSKKLLETFYISRPMLHSLPIMDKAKTYSNKLFIEDKLKKINEFQTKYKPIDDIGNCVETIAEFLSCVIAIFEHCENSDTNLLLHYLYSLKINWVLLHNKGNDKLISAKKNKLCKNDEKMLEVFEQLYHEIFSDHTRQCNIYNILYKYIDFMWNDSTTDTDIIIYGFNLDEIKEIEEWLNQRHLLFYCKNLAKHSEIVTDLNEFTKTSGDKIGKLLKYKTKTINGTKKKFVLIEHPFIIIKTSNTMYSNTNKIIFKNILHELEECLENGLYNL